MVCMWIIGRGNVRLGRRSSVHPRESLLTGWRGRIRGGLLPLFRFLREMELLSWSKKERENIEFILPKLAATIREIALEPTMK